MTGPDDASSTRPISVAELLAKNGTIGAAPPGGGRRRRRRGNSDSVTVAELTGEIPIYRTGSFPPEHSNGSGATETVEPVAAPEESRLDLDDPINRSVLADEPIPRRGRMVTPERSRYPRPARRIDPVEEPVRERVEEPVEEPPVAGAELMSPDPIEDIDSTGEAAPDIDDTSADDDVDAQPDELGIGDATYLQSYLRSTNGPLYSGQTVADDLARRGSEDVDLLVTEDAEVAEALDDDDVDEAQPPHESADTDELSRGQLVVRGCWVAVQSIVAVAFGAGLFIAFDQLWKWNNIVALVLSVLVILGLVVGVRVVRKTEDIASTLIAVAVGALVTLGPLALLQSN
jgi:hypothetical protein